MAKSLILLGIYLVLNFQFCSCFKSFTPITCNTIHFSQRFETTKDGVYIVDSMPPPLPANLRNTYYLLRHGQSWGNVEGVISSARSLATSEKHGLTPLGYEQGKKAADDLFDLVRSNVESTERSKSQNIFFYSSPFARARQTAMACAEAFVEKVEGLENYKISVNRNINIEYGLMERFFGRLDDEAIHTYSYVWPVDMWDPTHKAFDVESVAAVCTRLQETIQKIESSDLHKEASGNIIVLASHADVLQILQLYACGAENVGTFSSYRFQNGEVRLMGRSCDTLPAPQPLEPPKKGT